MTETHRTVPVTESSQPLAARSAAREAAALAGFDDQDVYRAGLVATELATNLVKHAVGGELLARPVHNGRLGEIEIIAMDRGPGMADVSRCLADGHSTAGSAGSGLGAVRRLADEFDIYSQQPRGTVVLARLRTRRAPPPPAPPLALAGVSIAKQGEATCGDAWQVGHHDDGALAIIADGLGHGAQAREASDAAIAAVNPRHRLDLPRLLETMHAGLRHTRGAAVALAEILPRAGLVRFAGVGNIGAAICGLNATRHVVSHNGTLGYEARHFREFSYPWESGALFVMHSDGLISHWSLDPYPGLRRRHPAVVAAVLYRDFNRQRDDVTVVVGREATS